MAKLANIIYKDFKFPYNPGTTSYKIDRTYIKHKYPELSGNELEDFGPNACVITGSGEFFGSGAYANWNKLLKEFKKGGIGSVSHPIFTDVTRGLMTSLQCTVEPRPDYVKYTFEIVADTEPVIKEYLSKYVSVVTSNNTQTSTPPASTGKMPNEFVHTVVPGEWVWKICRNYSNLFNTTIHPPTIIKYNNMKNPDIIYPGDKIKIYYPT